MSTPPTDPVEPVNSPSASPDSDSESASGVLDPYAESPASTSDPIDAEPKPEADELPPRSGWTLATLIPNDGKEPPADFGDDAAQSLWCALTALWHPALLAGAASLPRIEPIQDPSPPTPNELRVAAGGALGLLPSDYRERAEIVGSILVESSEDREATIREVRERLGAVESDPARSDLAEMVGDFLALGLVRWMVRDLSIAMGRSSAIDEDALAREALAAADAWRNGDAEAAAGRLRGAFEVLTRAREQSYPVDAHLLDLCLLDPALPAGSLAPALEGKTAVSFIASARAIEKQAREDPERIAELCQGVTDGWVDVAGGTYDEVEDPLLPFESVLWQYQRGGEVYREHLDERNVETFARRRFGLWNQVPQFSRRFGFRFAAHFALDGGRFPARAEPKRLWEAPDGSSLETLTRLPMAADRPNQGPRFAWRLADTMRRDHVATVPLVHWPSPVASWYLDLKRSARFSPVLARWTTLNDFFHLTDRPYETFRPEPDSYATPYLAQAAARKDPEPISALARHHGYRARLEAVRWARSMALAIGASAEPHEPAPDEPADIDAVENAIETRANAEAEAGLDALQPHWASALAERIGSVGAETSAEARPGYLVFNPLGVARKLGVILPGADPKLRPEGPLVAAQAMDDGVAAVVDLPAFGFAWVPRENHPDLPPTEPDGASAKGNALKNETIELEVDPGTGGVRGVRAVGESTARLGQQIVMTGLGEVDGKPVVSQMKRDRFEIERSGPAMVQALAVSRLVESESGRMLAKVSQRYRLWTGSPIVEIEITLDEIDQAWLQRAANSDPWTHGLACRWAWPDASAMLRRSVLMAPEPTEVERPEAADFLDVSTRRQRTALLFGGLPYHRRTGGRMLDTLLVAGSETGRTFRVGVALDSENPYREALDFLAPALVVSTDAGPPPLGDRGWLMRTDHRAVAITRVEFLPAESESHAWGLAVHVVETSGHTSRCRLRFFRNPTRARQCDFHGEGVVDLSVDGDAVLLDLISNETARIEVSFE